MSEELNPQDLRFDIATWGVSGDCAVRVTHLPTGQTASMKGRGHLAVKALLVEKLRRESVGARSS